MPLKEVALVMFPKDNHTLMFNVCIPMSCEDDGEEGLNDHDDGSIKENFREQDIYLPIANVARIMKNAVPQTGKVNRAEVEALPPDIFE